MVLREQEQSKWACVVERLGLSQLLWYLAMAQHTETCCWGRTESLDRSGFRNDLSVYFLRDLREKYMTS